MINNLDHIRDEIVRHAMGPNPRAAILNQWLDEFEAAVRSERTPTVPPHPVTLQPDTTLVCSDCGAPVTNTKHGRATLHRAGCQYPGERGPQL